MFHARSLFRCMTAALLAGSLAGPGLAQFNNPYTPAYRGGTGAEFSGWDCYTVASFGPNFPDDPSTTADDITVTQTQPGAILTGTCNIYNPAMASSFVVADTLPHDAQQVDVQVATLGIPIDPSSFSLEYVDGGGSTVSIPPSNLEDRNAGNEWLAQFDLGGIADEILAYSVHFDATGSHCSLDGVAVDTLTDSAELETDVPSISLSAGGSQQLFMDAGSDFAGLDVWMLGSFTGTTGFTLDGFHVPLDWDLYTTYTISLANSGPFQDFRTTLDDRGRATASLNVPAGTNPNVAGLTLHHAFLVLGAGSGLQVVESSNATDCDLTL